MNRRRFFQLTASTMVSLGAGCFGGSFVPHNEDLMFDIDQSTIPDESREIVSDISTGHPENGIFSGHIRADLISDSPRDPKPLIEYPSNVQREVLIAITRGRYYGTNDSTFAINSADVEPQSAIDYDGLTFMVEQVATTPQEINSDYLVPLELDATLETGELTLEVTNTNDASCKINYYERPYFGLLFAWDGKPHLLGHDEYLATEAIVIDDGRIYFNMNAQTKSIELSPQESIYETYIISEDVADEAFVWFDISFNASYRAVWTVSI